MNSNVFDLSSIGTANYLLALHSSSETLGVAVLDMQQPEECIQSLIFPTGRQLSNNILNCIDEVLPKKRWKGIARLAVATGPGSFTGLRLTIVMARTIAQQLGCQLDGISSFQLMASRLSRNLSNKDQPFWITKTLKRRGIVGGKYKIEKSKINNSSNVTELLAPHLIRPDIILDPAIEAEENVKEDVRLLLKKSLAEHRNNVISDWSKILPIYPTSPIC